MDIYLIGVYHANQSVLLKFGVCFSANVLTAVETNWVLAFFCKVRPVENLCECSIKSYLSKEVVVLLWSQTVSCST